MSVPTLDCGGVRRIVLERAANRIKDRPPGDVEAHLTGCAGCRRYAEGLRIAAELSPCGQLYTAKLKQRTLEAVHKSLQPAEYRLALVLSLPALLSMSLFIALPAYLLYRLIPADVLLAPAPLALGLLAAHAAGAAVVIPFITFLLHRQARHRSFQEAFHG